MLLEAFVLNLQAIEIQTMLLARYAATLIKNNGLKMLHSLPCALDVVH